MGEERLVPCDRLGKLDRVILHSVDRSRLPIDAETPEMLYARAGRCIEYLRAHYADKSVLVVAHGQINRNIIAQAKGIPLSRLKDVPLMKNASVEVLGISDGFR